MSPDKAQDRLKMVPNIAPMWPRRHQAGPRWSACGPNMAAHGPIPFEMAPIYSSNCGGSSNCSNNNNVTAAPAAVGVAVAVVIIMVTGSINNFLHYRSFDAQTLRSIEGVSGRGEAFRIRHVYIHVESSHIAPYEMDALDTHTALYCTTPAWCRWLRTSARRS
jgi:hypothetical protein